MGRDIHISDGTVVSMKVMTVAVIVLCLYPTFVTWYLLRKRRRAETWQLG